MDFLASAGSHVALIAETHALVDCEQLMGSTLSRQRFTTFSAPAVASTSCGKGSFGGAAASVRTYLNTSPLAGSEKMRSVWSQVDSNYFAGCWLHLKSSCVLFGSGYCRGGIDSAEGLQVLHAIRRHSQVGYIPFVVGGDFNATPQ